MKIQTEGKFTVAIFVIAAFVLALGVASAADIFVGPGETHTTIQSAVTAANPFDTIIVRNGTYSENVLVNKQLTIRSENGSVNCIVSANDTNDHVFHVTADWVNITGFNVTGATFPFSGIYLDSVNNCTISNNTASGNGFGIELWSSNYNNLINNTANSNSMYGINLHSSSYNNLVNNIASNNENGIFLWESSNNNNLVNNIASHNLYNGIRLDYYSNYNNLTGNNASNNSQYGIYLVYYSNYNNLTDNTASNNSQYGIYLDFHCNYNNLTDNTASNSPFPYSGIFLKDSSNYNNLVENTVSNNFAGISLSTSSSYNNLTGNNASNNKNGIYLSSSSYNNLTKNTANSNTGNGIFLSSSSSNNLTGNTVSNNNYGIALSISSSYNNLTDNTVSNNTYGITLSSSSNNTITCNWVHHNTHGFFIVWAVGASTGNTIESNNIIENGNYNFNNQQPENVEAKNNYWGLVNNVTIDASIYDNEESSGSCGAVTFYPFETRPVPCAPGPLLGVTKTVWNGTAWVTEVKDVHLNDTFRFNCTITNIGTVNLSQVRFWDILDCSLNFSGNETLELSGEDVDISLDGTYVFKPRVLHPDNLSWDPYKPQPYELFAELCPNNDTWHLQDWDDANNDSRVSACDQIFFEGVALWCHVENVPYTLLVNNTAANMSMYIDSALDYESLNLSTPNGTEWLGVCCCKDRYNLTAWNDLNVTGDLNVNDTLVLQNLRTGEVAQYTVEEVTIDLVVSREWELNTLHYPDPVIFEPNQSITIEYNATVIRCGVDNNTFRAKGNYSNVWTYSNADKVTITVPCPGGYASDSGGTEQEVYYTDETVYATGSGFTPNSEVDIYITEDKHWVDGTPINSTIYKEKHNVTTDGNGSITGEEIWPNPDPGEYDIVYDTNNNMIFDLGVDAVDNENDPGFIVLKRERVPTLTPLGILALMGLLSVIAINTIERTKKR